MLSALLFPGLGHIYLKKYIQGTVLASISLAGMYYVISKTVEQALQITEKIQSGEVQVDIAAITDLVAKQSSGAEAHFIDIATAVVTICWLIGIFDSYRVGKLLDKNIDVSARGWEYGYLENWARLSISIA